jgi:WG containing repeat/Short C-terminal domain
MGKSIGIGLIIGLIVAVVTMINRSDNYSSSQKIFLSIACVVFFPGGLVALLIVYLYNSSKSKAADALNSNDRIKHTSSSSSKEDNLNLSVIQSETKSTVSKPTKNEKRNQNIGQLSQKLELLQRSYDKGLLSQSEYHLKVSELNLLLVEKNEENIYEFLLEQNKELIDQLVDLLQSDLITESEFESKKTKIMTSARQKYDEELIVRDPNNFNPERNPDSGLYGYKDQSGNVVISYKFEDAYPFYEGLAHVVYEEKSGYIDKSGTFIIPPIYDALSCSHFKDGVATVDLNGDSFNINSEGNRI